MSNQFITAALLTFIIHFVSTLSYSVRIVGIRTGRIAVSFALFNIMVLISRSANAMQAPLLAKTVENNIVHGLPSDTAPFRFILIASAMATVAGAVMIPSFQRIFSKMVEDFSIYRSVPKLLFHSFSKSGISQIKDRVKLPSRNNVTRFISLKGIPLHILFLNVIAVAILSVGVLAALYAGYFSPELRTTSSMLSSVVNFTATIIMFVFIDPSLSALTDDVVLGKYSEARFRKFVVLMVGSRFIGTLVAQLIFIPAAEAISFIAKLI